MLRVEHAQPETAPRTPPPAPVSEPDRVVLEELPAQPETVRLDYPDGARMHAGWQYAGPADGGHEQYIVRLPATATLVNGMVVRTARDVVLSVAVNDLPVRLRRIGGATDAL